MVSASIATNKKNTARRVSSLESSSSLSEPKPKVSLFFYILIYMNYNSEEDDDDQLLKDASTRC